MDLVDKYYERNSEDVELTKAEDIVFSVLEEMRGRRGMDGFGDCDTDIQEEMLQTWIGIVDEKLKES